MITALEGKWDEQKSRLKQRFASLTDLDLLFESGRKEDMLEKLQVKLGKTKEQLHQIIESL